MEALASRLQKKITRINLSDQTDIADLFGSDLPVEGGDAGHFEWRNGPFLDAMEQGHWILLDELNLASQSILEGLNAVFDHRNEVYIPELNRTFPLHSQTKIFACQNPISEGGDRKGLPKSFLNRFSKIFMSGLCDDDYVIICESIHPNIGTELVNKMVQFSSSLEKEIVVKKAWGQCGAPWEFNLRDLLRWCQATESDEVPDPGKWVNIIYCARMRTETDRKNVETIFTNIFSPGYKLVPVHGNVHLSLDKLYIGNFSLERQKRLAPSSHLSLLSAQGPSLEMMTACVSRGWPVLLTGPSQAGKTALVSSLASLAGVKIVTVSLNISTDSMELLGGFEQSDVDRSVGDLWTRVCSWVLEVTQKILTGGKIEDGLLFMQRFLQLEHHYKEASLRRHRSEQQKIINEVILSVRSTNIAISECEQFLVELGRLGSVQQGTFQWVDSSLVQAMQCGHWVVLDTANACSASVLDRLNSLMEDGGRLVVSERGVLSGDIVTVTRHPNFRAFIIYDPIKGEISRAMRNRCVEIYVKGEYLSEEDRQHLVNRVLGPASLSVAGTEAARLVSDKTEGLQNLMNKWTLVRHDVLAGGLNREDGYISENKLKRVLTSLMTSMSTASLDHSLFNNLHQLRPIFAVQEHMPHLLHRAVELLILFQTPESLTKMFSLVSSMLGSEEWLHNWLAKQRHLIGAGDPRMLPSSARSSLSHGEVSEANKRCLVLSIMTGLERQFGFATEEEGSLASVGHLATEAMILSQYPRLVSSLLVSLKTDILNSLDIMTDQDWEVTDRSLDHLAHFVALGGRTLLMESRESQTRCVGLHWSWVYKHLMRWLPSQAGNTRHIMDEYNKTVTAGLPASTRAMTKLKRKLGCAPLPPSNTSERDSRLCLKRICENPVLAVIKHRVNFMAKHDTDIREKLTFLVNGKLDLEEFTRQVEGILLVFLQQVEEQDSFTMSVDTFLNIQLSGLKEGLNKIGMKTNIDHQLMSLRSRISERLESPSEMYIDQVLEKFDRPGKRLLENIEFDPIFMKVKTKSDSQEIPNDILHITQTLSSESNINIAMAEDKFSQINEMKDILCNINPKSQCKSFEIVMLELSSLLDAMTFYFKLDQSNDIQIQINRLGKVTELFQGYGDLMSKIGTEVSLKNDLEREATLKLDILLNLLKLQLFCMVGIMDPAEKQVIKKKYTEEDLQLVTGRLKVFSLFNEIIGCHHSHSELLEEREKHLATEASRRSGLVAVRSHDENFYNLSNELSHFAKTVGQVSTVMEVVSKIQTNLCETNTWVTSVISFVRSLQSYSTFPDITAPVCESSCRLASSMKDLAAMVAEGRVREQWDNVDRIIVGVSARLPDPSIQFLDYARWLLSGNMLNFFDKSNRLLFLRSSLMFINMSSVPDQRGDILLKITGDLLHLWREDEALKERQAAEAESLYRTQTLCQEDDDDTVIEKEYSSLFPSFSDIFNEEGEKDEDKKIKENELSNCMRNQINETIILLTNSLLEKDNANQIPDIDNHSQRFELALWACRNYPGILSRDLELKMITNQISAITGIIQKNEQKTEQNYNFYKDSNIEESSKLRPLLSIVADKIIKLLNVFPENPVLLQVLKIKTKVSSMLISAPLPQLLTGLEVLLTSCQEWQKNAHKGVSIQSEMDQIIQVILSWRKLELSCLKVLLSDHLTKVREETIAKFWLHVVSIVMEKRNKKEDVVRSLIRFMEAASISDFSARLDILKSVAKLSQIAARDSSVTSVLLNLFTYYSDLNLGVEKALESQNQTADSKLKEYLKIAKWKDTNFWSVQTIMDKTKKALHKVLRDYQKNISNPCNEFFKEASFDSVKAEDVTDTFENGILIRTPTTLGFNVLSSQGRKIGKCSIYVQYNSMIYKHSIILGTLSALDVKCIKWSCKTSDTLSNSDIVTTITKILPEVISEMDELRNLCVDRTKPEKEQKKQAGFIQQRKRARLNELFKTLQSFGFSYRFGVTNCVDVTNYTEMYDHGSDILDESWQKSEKYFYRCFARYRHLLSLLDRAPPPDIGSQLNERFQGFAQHMLSVARNWRKNNMQFLISMTALERELAQFETPDHFDRSRSGVKYKKLILECLETMVHMAALLELRSKEYIGVPQLKPASEFCREIATKLQTRISEADTIFAPSDNGEVTSDLLSGLNKIINLVSQAENIKSQHPIGSEFRQIQAKLRSVVKHLDAWAMMRPLTYTQRGVDVKVNLN